MIANTLKLLTSSKIKGDKKTSKTPQSLHSTLAQNLRKNTSANFSQLLSEAKESKDVKKNKNLSKIQTSKLAPRKKSEAISLAQMPISTPIVPLNAPLQPQNTKVSKSEKLTAKMRVGKQSTQEQLLLQKQLKTPLMAKKQIRPPLNEMLNQPKKAKQEQKTLGDVLKIAQDNQLNLTKLELKTQEGTPLPTQKAKVRKEAREMKEVKEVKVERNPQLLSKIPQKTQKLAQKEPEKVEAKSLKQEVNLQPQPLALAPKEEPQNQEKIKDFTLSDLLKATPKAPIKEQIISLEGKEEQKVEEKVKEAKPQELSLTELKKDTQFKIASNREILNQFSQRIREEILNYKPPFTKLSMELNPVELGKLEITITKKGKELVINVNASNPNALHAFMQNQNDFRATLSNVGFNNVELNFSQGEGREKNPQQEEKNQKRNKNSLEETITEIPALASMEIKMVQYA